MSRTLLAATAVVLLVGAGCSPADPLTERAPAGPTRTSATTAAATGSAPAEATPASPSTAAASRPRATLPRGGRTVFPQHRLVGYAGRTGSPTLGRLGTGGLDSRVGEMIDRAQPYAADGRRVLPVLEVVATVVQGSPGRDGKYRTRMSDPQVEVYLKAARRHKAVLLLAIQPGRADFLPEVKAYEKWLAQPDVGVALDPEWAMDEGQRPGRTFGHTTGSELDSVSRYLSALVAEHDLPQKVMVFHELAPRIVTGEGKLRPHPGVAVVKSVDGIGSPAAKRNTYRVVNEDTPSFVQPGFKLFYDEDREAGPLMKPADVLRLRPRPAYVLYE